MKQYNIIMFKEINPNEADPINAIKAKIDNNPWLGKGIGPAPLSTAGVLAFKDGLQIELFAGEKKLRSTVTEMNGPIYCDSCLEFFFNADPDNSDLYFNFEINPLGTLFLAIGKDRENREHINIPDYKKFFKIDASIEPDEWWKVRYFIPDLFIKEYFPHYRPDEGGHIMGNFYKCGDKTDSPHFGCWNVVKWEKPDFHRPEFFGKLGFTRKS